jgi:hypothetical protein
LLKRIKTWVPAFAGTTGYQPLNRDFIEPGL